MIVTIDGPAGAGKSSAAKALAKRLGIEVLDTGAMYRAVALAGLRAGIDLENVSEIEALLATLHLELPTNLVLLSGEDVTSLLRAPNVTAAAGRLARLPVVRHYLVQIQRRIGAERELVTEGRDQGTVVFPQATRKFFLVADPNERARRRWLEMQARGEKTSLEEVLRAQQERDKMDAARDASPMVPASDALIVDTSRMDLAEVVDFMESEVRRCQIGSSAPGTISSRSHPPRD